MIDPPRDSLVTWVCWDVSVFGSEHGNVLTSLAHTRLSTTLLGSSHDVLGIGRLFGSLGKTICCFCIFI